MHAHEGKGLVASSPWIQKEAQAGKHEEAGYGEEIAHRDRAEGIKVSAQVESPLSGPFQMGIGAHNDFIL